MTRSTLDLLCVKSEFRALILGVALLSSLRVQADDAKAPLNIGTRLEIFVDQFLIDRLDGTRLKLSEPKQAGVAILFNDSWDGACSGYATILQDKGTYRMYYVGLPMDDKDEEAGSFVCYAESNDGIKWVKPSLGLTEYRGSKKNNILFLGNKNEPYAVNFSPFIDTRPGVPASERYKAVGGSWPKGMFVLVSDDGLRWQKWREAPVFSNGAFDTQNVAFWSEAESCYVLYFRVFTGTTDYVGQRKWGISGYRTIARTTSPDLVNWSEPRRMSFGSAPIEHFYTNHTRPYFRAPHIYTAMPMRFVPGRRFLTNEQLADLQVVPHYLNIKGNTHNIPLEVSDTVLLTSRGGSRYDRTFMEAFIRPGLDEANWVSRNGIPATGMIQTGAAEMSIYVAQHYAQPTAYMGRFTLRLDGFASVNAPYAGGEMVTKVMIVTGSELVLNCATSAPGSVRVEVQTPDGDPIPGFTLAESKEFVGDSIEETVQWKLGPSLSALAGKPVRLRFVMKDADVYSLRFRSR